MKILLYNWVQYDDSERRGGGIRVYESNLVDYLVRNTEHEIVVLSSGLEQDVSNRKLRMEETTNSHPGRVRSFSIVNSPILAPGHHSFGNPQMFEQGPMLHLWHRFLAELGPFDVIQFDSFEGIPFTFIDVHGMHPQTAVFAYAHNYYLVCPQVNLWKKEAELCVDYHNGRDCINCVPKLANPVEVQRAYQISRMLRKVRIHPGTTAYRRAYRAYGIVRRSPGSRVAKALLRRALAQGQPGNGQLPEKAESASVPEHGDPTLEVAPVSLRRSTTYKERRERALELINSSADRVLATSNRVKEVLAQHGITDDKIEVTYIGTKAAESFAGSERRKELLKSGELTIAYLGYMRRDKGFYFLMQALERCPAELRSKIRLVLAAQTTDSTTMTRLESLAESLLDVVHFDGYTHEQLPEILRTVDVGVVPVQWEDNLPQVAIEMVACGIPIITSHRGGAKELGGPNPSFVFNATSWRELIEIWRRLLDGELQPGDYWSDAVPLVTMDDHIARLTEQYDRVLEERRALT